MSLPTLPSICTIIRCDHYTLKDVAIIESNEHLRSEITLTYRGLFMAELIMKTHGGESELEYELLSQGLRFLQSGIADRVLIQFVLRLARILGVHADYEACPVCSRKYRDDETLRFTTDLLSPCCSECGSADLRCLRCSPLCEADFYPRIWGKSERSAQRDGYRQNQRLCPFIRKLLARTAEDAAERSFVTRDEEMTMDDRVGEGTC